MSQFVTVSDVVWHEALRAMDPLSIWPDPDKRERNLDADHEYPRALVEAAVAYLSDDLGCDHSVNICMCGTVAVVQELVLNLDGKQTCGACSGEGATWDRTRWEEARAKQIALWRGQELWDIGDGPGYLPCQTCNEKGTVPYGIL